MNRRDFISRLSAAFATALASPVLEQLASPFTPIAHDPYAFAAAVDFMDCRFKERVFRMINADLFADDRGAGRPL